jgi:hypothetical protein
MMTRGLTNSGRGDYQFSALCGEKELLLKRKLIQDLGTLL